MMRTILATFTAALFLGACGPGEAPPAEEAQTAAPAAEDKLWEGIGTIESIDDNNQRITIAHQEIPGLMAAMTMPFAVEDPSQLDGLEPGMEVSFRLRVTASRYIIVEISPVPE